MAHGSEQPGMATDLAQQASERTNAVASWLEEREPGHVVDEITRFARQRPGTFLAARRRCWSPRGPSRPRSESSHDDSGDGASPRILVTPRTSGWTTPAARVMPPPRYPRSRRTRPHRATTPADTNPHPATNSRRHRATRRRHRATRRRHRVTRRGPVGGIWRRERSLRRAPGRPRRAGAVVGRVVR